MPDPGRPRLPRKMRRQHPRNDRQRIRQWPRPLPTVARTRPRARPPVAVRCAAGTHPAARIRRAADSPAARIRRAADSPVGCFRRAADSPAAGNRRAADSPVGCFRRAADSPAEGTHQAAAIRPAANVRPAPARPATGVAEPAFGLARLARVVGPADLAGVLPAMTALQAVDRPRTATAAGLADPAAATAAGSAGPARPLNSAAPVELEWAEVERAEAARRASPLAHPWARPAIRVLRRAAPDRAQVGVRWWGAADPMAVERA